MKIYDGAGQIAGRLATRIAKDLLNGEEVVVVNAEKIILSGKKEAKLKEFQARRARGDPKKGPFYPRYPDGIFRRMVRGMLPWHKPKGRKAFKRLKVYIGEPEEFKHKEKIKLKDADASKLKVKYVSLGEISVLLGAEKRW